MDVYQRRRLVALSALAVVFIGFVLLIKSCGGDDEEEPVAPLAGATGTGGATVIPQADYIDQGDAICLEANTSLANVDQSDPVQAARDEADIVAGELEQLQSLPEPDDGTTKLGNFLNALEKQAAAYDDRATAVERDDQETVTELDGTIDKAGDEASSAAKNFGFEGCGTSKVSESSGDSGGDTDADADASTDTGGAAVTPTTTTEVPVTPTPTTPAPTTPAVTPTEPAPTDGGGATPEAPPADTGDDSGGTSSGGVSP